MCAIFSRISVLAGVMAFSCFAYAAPVYLKSGTFDPVTYKSSRATNEMQLIVVQARPGEIWNLREELSGRGIAELEYLPTDALLVRAEPSQLESLSSVLATMPYASEMKVSSEFGTRTFQWPQRQQEVAQGLRRADILFSADSDLFFAEVMLQNTGVEVLASTMMGPNPVVSVIGDPELIQALAINPFIVMIEESGEGRQRNNTVRWIIQTNTLDSTPLYTAGITGQNMVAGITDGLLKADHTSFSDTVAIGPTHRKVVYRDTGGTDSHGTHTAGTLAGDAGAMNDRRGVAFSAKIAMGAYPSISSAPTALPPKFDTLYNFGARDFSNSWGDDGSFSYTLFSRAIDQYSWDKETVVIGFASTNASGLRIPENAKSVLAVSSSSDTPNQENRFSGGTGPTADGRRKPDVITPGQSITSAGTGTTTATATLSGNSMACPSAVGTSILVRQYLREGRIQTGTALPAATLEPSGALLRAILSNGTRDMTGVAGFPSNGEGWGRIAITDALYLGASSKRLLVQDVFNANGLSNGQSATYQFKVNSNSKPLRVTMVYTDFPPSGATATPVVNNLNLSVQSGASTFLGNVITNGDSATGGSADVLNSTEQVHRLTPATGIYTVTVTGANVVSSNGKQGYALAITGDVKAGEISGTLSSPGYVGSYPTSIPVTFLTAAGAVVPGGNFNATVNPTTGAFTVDAPVLLPNSYRMRLDFGTFLRRVYPSQSQPALTNKFATGQAVVMVNGDIDNDGEVGPGDFEVVVSNFGTAGPSGDVDGDGEVGPGDFEIVVANFGRNNE
jgi:hypothetical protein